MQVKKKNNMAGDKHSISPHRNSVNQETESISLQHCCCEMRQVKMVSSETTVGPDHRTRPRDPHLLECAEKNKIGSPIHTGYFHIGEENTLILIVDGCNTVNSFVMDPLEHGPSSLKKIIQNSNFKKRVYLEDQKAQLDDRFLRGRQIAFMIMNTSG